MVRTSLHLDVRTSLRLHSSCEEDEDFFARSDVRTSTHSRSCCEEDRLAMLPFERVRKRERDCRRSLLVSPDLNHLMINISFRTFNVRTIY